MATARKTPRKTSAAGVAVSEEKRLGRPPLELNLADIENLAGRGLTHAQIADSLGVSARALFNHKARDQEVADAIKRGQAKGVFVVASALMEQVKKGNVTAQIFYLKCRGGWTETQRVELTTPWEEAMRRLDEEEGGGSQTV
jgi:hypothetical protein